MSSQMQKIEIHLARHMCILLTAWQQTEFSGGITFVRFSQILYLFDTSTSSSHHHRFLHPSHPSHHIVATTCPSGIRGAIVLHDDFWLPAHSQSRT
jgi:hypothetical protein